MTLHEGDILRKVSLMNIYYIPGTVLGTEITSGNQIDAVSAIMKQSDNFLKPRNTVNLLCVDKAHTKTHHN